MSGPNEIKTLMDGLDKIEQKITKVEDELKNSEISKTAAEQKLDELGKKQVELANAIRELEQKTEGFQVAGEEKVLSIGEKFVKEVDHDAFARYKNVSVEIETKAALTTAASNSVSRTNSVAPMVRPGLISLPDMPLVIESLFPSIPTTSNSVEYSKEGTFTNNAAIVAEAGSKPESTFTGPSLALANIVTIAHWTKITKQLAADNPALAAYINQKMLYGLQLKVDNQLINGTGGTTQLSGLLNTGNYVDPSATLQDKLAANSTLFDYALWLKSYMESSVNIAPQGFVFNPLDWTNLCLIKDSNGNYILGGPQMVAGKSLWGVPVITSGSMTEGKFLMGNFTLAGTIYNREAINISMSEHDDKNFQQNLITIRVERRLGFAVEQPNAMFGGAWALPKA